jgi:hypothetical protein
MALGFSIITNAGSAKKRSYIIRAIKSDFAPRGPTSQLYQSAVAERRWLCERRPERIPALKRTVFISHRENTSPNRANLA